MNNEDKVTNEDLAREALAVATRLADSVEDYVGALHRTARRDATWTIAKRVVIAVVAGLFALLYLAVYAPLMGAKSDPIHPAIVQVQIKGDIGRDEASADKVVPLIARACRQDNARALVLLISSPGGSPTDAERMVSAVHACRRDKPGLPIIAAIESVGASAGYLVAMSADTVVANRFALVGSIGAVMTSVDASAAAEQFGITERSYASGSLKAANGTFTQNTPDQDRLMQSLVDGVAQEFIAQVKASRGDRLKQDAEDLFSGRVWIASEAQAIGLVDHVGVLDDCLHASHPDLPLHIYRPTKTVNDFIGSKAWAKEVLVDVLADLRGVQVQ